MPESCCATVRTLSVSITDLEGVVQSLSEEVDWLINRSGFSFPQTPLETHPISQDPTSRIDEITRRVLAIRCDINNLGDRF